MKDEYFHTTVVAYLCQQAIEKYFKAFLLENVWKLEKTHDLPYLYEEIKKIKNLNLDKKMIKDVFIISIDTRYPGDIWPPTKEEVGEFYKFAQEVEQTIKKELGA